MRNLKSRIEITPRAESGRPPKVTKIFGLTSFRALSSVDKLTDTCEVELPRGLEVGNRLLQPGSVGQAGRKVSTSIEIQQGDYIEVFLAYDQFEDIPRFQGYVKRIHPTRPIRLECEDRMYLLKEPSIEKLSFGKESADGPATLQNIIDTLATYNLNLLGFDKTIIDGDIMGSVRYKNSTPAEILKDLRDNAYTTVFFQDGELFVGRNFWKKYRNESPIKFDFNFNIIEDSLEYRRKEDIKILVEGRRKFLNSEGKVEEQRVEVGDSGGVRRTINFPMTYETPENDEGLKRLAEKARNDIAFEGYQGTFTTFGIPRVHHGDIVNLTDRRYPDKEGDYFVREVETTFGSGGFRQTVELDIKSDEVDDVALEN